MTRSEELMALEISLLLDMGRRYGQMIKKSSPERECAEARKRAGRGGQLRAGQAEAAAGKAGGGTRGRTAGR